MTHFHDGWSEATNRAVIMGIKSKPTGSVHRRAVSRSYFQIENQSTESAVSTVVLIAMAYEEKGNDPISAWRSSESQPILHKLAEIGRKRKKDRMHSFVTRSSWGIACKEMFFDLAEQQSTILADLIESGYLKDTQLTFAAEALGGLQDIALVKNILAPLLEHHASFVREGAVYGLGQHCTDPEIQNLLRRRRSIEPSPGVREAIDEVLEGESEF